MVGETRTFSRQPSLSSSHSPQPIPAIAPKPVKGNLPSAISIPQLGLVSITADQRHPAVGDSPSHPASPPAGASRPSGLPTLKSLRSFLPFGGNGGASNGTTSGASNPLFSPGPKNPFPSFATAGRRSLAFERKTSGTFLRPSAALVPENTAEVPLVISIEASPRQRKDGISLKTSPVLPSAILPAPHTSHHTPDRCEAEELLPSAYTCRH
jgi:hypothetical protein